MFVNANTIFIGLPLNLALFGDKAVPYFLMYYVVNTVSTWTVGAFIMAWDDPTQEKAEKAAPALTGRSYCQRHWLVSWLR
ncbi:hypothetical protein V3472_12050 [Lacticaseibacillus rhamnosus]